MTRTATRTTRKAASSRPQLLLACALLVSACGTAPQDPTKSGAVVLATGGTTDDVSPAVRFHEGVLERLRDAWVERDVDLMANLLATSRVGATAEQLASYESYETLRASGVVEASGFRDKGFRFVDADKLDGGRVPPDLELGQEAPLELRIGASPGFTFRIPKAAGDAVTRFVITTHFEEWRVDGSVTRSETPYRFAAQRDLKIEGDVPFVIPLPSLPEASDGILFRTVRVDGALFCAAFVEKTEDGEASRMIPRIDLEPARATQFLAGFRTSKVRSAPVDVLAVATRDPGRFAPHLLTASYFLARDGDSAAKEKGMPLLIEALRRTSAARKTVLAALLLVAGEDDAPKMRDRDAWLRWWDLRRRDTDSER